jgi:hypothetical protein
MLAKGTSPETCSAPEWYRLLWDHHLEEEARAAAAMDEEARPYDPTDEYDVDDDLDDGFAAKEL